MVVVGSGWWLVTLAGVGLLTYFSIQLCPKINIVTRANKGQFKFHVCRFAPRYSPR